MRQSDHRGFYASVLSALRQAGRLYPCRCSRRLLLADASAPHGALAVYPGFCRKMRTLLGAGGGRLPSGVCAGAGRCGGRSVGLCGRQTAPTTLEMCSAQGRRGGGDDLATAVDELLMGISEVARGDDLCPRSGSQVAAMAALGAPPPSYADLPCRDGRGERLRSEKGARVGRPAAEGRGTPPLGSAAGVEPGTGAAGQPSERQGSAVSVFMEGLERRPAADRP